MSNEPITVMDRIVTPTVKLSIETSDYKKFWLATRNCYFKGTLEDLDKSFTIEKTRKLIRHIIKGKHLSCLEHIQVFVTLEGVSRSFLAQIRTHRHATFHVSSQHFQVHKDFLFVLPEITNEYKDHMEFLRIMNILNESYNKMVSKGIPHFIARQILPNAAACKIIISLNLRELRYIINLRQGPENTPEMSQIMGIIKTKLREIDETFLYLMEE